MGGLVLGAEVGGLDVALKAASALKGARGLLPEALKTEGEILAVILAGQELGLPPMAALRGLQVVRGKTIVSYDTMIALLKSNGYRVQWLHSDNESAKVRLVDRSGDEYESLFTSEDAKRAGLWGSATWAKYPATMLRARAISSAARAFAADVLAGVYTEDEGEEIRGNGHRLRVREVSSAGVIESPVETVVAMLPAKQDELQELFNGLCSCDSPEAVKHWVKTSRETIAGISKENKKEFWESAKIPLSSLGVTMDQLKAWAAEEVQNG